MEPGFDSRVSVLKQHMKGMSWPERVFNDSRPSKNGYIACIGGWLMVTGSGEERDGIQLSSPGTLRRVAG